MLFAKALNTARKPPWAIASLVAIAAVVWALADTYPDQIYSAYLQIRRWIAAAGPIPKLAVPSSTSRDKHGGFAVIEAGVARATKGRTWHPSMLDIYGLEASLPQVSWLKAENGPTDSHIRIDHPERYFRQYIGVIQKGRKLIYVNAFWDDIAVSYWRERLVIIMDGGTCCWQALYDPTSSTFITLRINGDG